MNSTLRNEGLFGSAVPHSLQNRRVVHGEQSQHLSPSDPALAPTSLMARLGMWAPIAGGRQTGERQHQRKAQRRQRIVYGKDVSYKYEMYIHMSTYSMQLLTISIWE